MTPTYPIDFGTHASWARENNLPVSEAKTRFAQYAVLCGITNSGVFGEGVVFKGGNALDFIWLPNRSTKDLDFSVDQEISQFESNEEEIHRLLQNGLDRVGPRLNMVMRVHRVTQQPPGKDKTFVTFKATVMFALPDQLPLQLRLRNGEVVAQNIPVDVSINEPICRAIETMLEGPSALALRVSTLEDIVAEKLRALLQQPLRKRTRCQDLLDIAVILSAGIPLDRDQVARFLTIKSASRDVTVTRTSFHNPEIGIRAKHQYAELERTTRNTFIPFEEALAMLLAFVDELDIPEN